ncbi:MAG: Asp-tRNA(Asn)/Glu-tRNA(Gln) amidotransferase subunit GatB [Nitrososphaerales archaeon]
MLNVEETLEVKIGLEVHCHLTSLKTKLFCRCPADYYNKEPNTNICPVCMGLPGSLPVLNEQAVKHALAIALALGSRVSQKMVFYRKNYFYPDLPKNFQISQYDKVGGLPLATGGQIRLKDKVVRIRRIQLEEDPAKIVYEGSISTSPYALVDYNRSGVALVEIVTEPDLTTPKQARQFLQKLRAILEHLGVCNCDLEAALRCDANISVRGGYRVEIKNIGSFKDVEKALSFEVTRQKMLGAKRGMETRHWDDVRGVTVSLRVKEEEQDYRYFPEADLPPYIITEDLIAETLASMPELPDARRDRFIKQYNLPHQAAEILTSHKSLADLFEKSIEKYRSPLRIANWLISDILGYLNRKDLDPSTLKIAPEDIAALARAVDEGLINEQTGRNLLLKAATTGKRVEQKIFAEVSKIGDEATIKALVDRVFKENEKAVKDALKNEKAINYLIGLVMKASGGKTDPHITRSVIVAKLKQLS